MKKTLILAALAAISPIAAGSVMAADAPVAAAAAKFNTTDTDLGTLLDNAATKAVLMKHIPEMVSNAQIDMARSMTLKQLQSYAGEALTDAKLASIDADLAAVK